MNNIENTLINTDLLLIDNIKKLNKSCKQKKLLNLQIIQMNNQTNLSSISNINMIWENINTSDEHIINLMSNSINNTYQKKINFINLILKSSKPFPIKSSNDLIKFFIFLNILNIEYLLASREWNIKIINNDLNNKIFFQNSISKSNCSQLFYKHFIDPIKNLLTVSNIKYHYFEFKLKRFNKIKDIIFVFDLNQF